MKKLKKIIKQNPVILHDWSEEGKFSIICDFEDIYMSKQEYEAKNSPYPNIPLWLENKEKVRNALEKWKPIHVLFASYTYEDYSGNAFVLFEKEGKLYEVHGGHCSCYGLEGQFDPEEITLDALKMRLEKGTYGDGEYKEELKKFIGL